MRRFYTIIILAAVCLSPSLDAADQLMEVRTLRRPVALEHLSDLDQLVVLNQRSASLSFFNLTDRQVVNEIALGGKPTDMEVITGTNIIAITNEATHLVSLYEVRDNSVAPLADIQVCAYPRHLQYEPNQGLLFVSGMWSRPVSYTHLTLPTNREV